MNVIPHARAIRGIIIIAEYSQLWKLSHCHLSNVGHQIVGDSIGIFTNGTTLMSADRIKVAKQNHIPLAICLLDITEYLLQHGLRPAVGICALSFGALLRDGHKSRIAINSSAGRKYNVLNPVLSHHIY